MIYSKQIICMSQKSMERDSLDDEIIRLLQESESVEDDEVQMWIDIFPQMESLHKNRLKEILLSEKEKI